MVKDRVLIVEYPDGGKRFQTGDKVILDADIEAIIKMIVVNESAKTASIFFDVPWTSVINLSNARNYEYGVIGDEDEEKPNVG